MKKFSSVRSSIEKQRIKDNRKLMAAGLLLTFVFACADLYVLYTMLIYSNYTEQASAIIAAMAAFMLDAPPYFLGYFLTRYNDKFLPETDRNRAKGLRNLVLVVSLVVMTVYILVRVLVFIGGGDFNTGFQIMYGTKTLGQNINAINAADVFSALIPIVTSVLSLAVGFILYQPADKVLEKLRNAATVRQAELDAEIENTKQALLDEAKIAWTSHGKGKPFPSDSLDGIIGALFTGYLQNVSSMYVDDYKTCIQNNHIEAETAMEAASNAVAEHTAMPDDVRDFEIKPQEQNILTELSKIDEEDIKTINTRLKSLRRA